MMTSGPKAMTGWELGYRTRPLSFLSIDVTAFVQDYDRLRSQEAPTVGIIPLTVTNTLNGRSRVVELAVNVEPVSQWRVRLGYTRLNTKITRDITSRDVSGGVNEANDPSYSATM